MSLGLLFGADAAVATWAWTTHGMTPMSVDHAIGVIKPDGTLVGAALFQNHNGNNVDFSYYGAGTFTYNFMRAFARVALQMNASRVTVMTSKKHKRILRALPKLGFRLEGVSRCFYGQKDCPRSTAVRFVLFRSELERTARIETPRSSETATK